MDAADEAEEVNVHFYRAVRDGLIVPTGADQDGALYDLTEIGKVRARVLAPYYHLDPDLMNEAQALAVVTEIVGL
jgi:hypothetical protein